MNLDHGTLSRDSVGLVQHSSCWGYLCLILLDSNVIKVGLLYYFEDYTIRLCNSYDTRQTFCKGEATFQGCKPRTSSFQSLWMAWLLCVEVFE